MSARQWCWPLVLGALTIAGLVAALLGEGGGWRTASWVALGLPLAVAARCAVRPIPRANSADRPFGTIRRTRAL